MQVLEASIVDKKTGQNIKKMEFMDSGSDLYVKGGNEQNRYLPMTFIIRGNFTIFKETDAGKTIRFKADGFNEEVKLLEMTNEMIKIETSHEVGMKLKAAGL